MILISKVVVFYQCRRTRGSMMPYKTSASIFTVIKKVAVSKTLPITTGKSNFSSASTVTFPIPFHPKIYSTKKAPASNSANHPVMAVTTGFSALRNAQLEMKKNNSNPAIWAGFELIGE